MDLRNYLGSVRVHASTLARSILISSVVAAAATLGNAADANTIESDGPVMLGGKGVGTEVSYDNETRVHTITEGMPDGDKLFHSFKRFDLDSKAIALFDNTRGGDIAFVISRVTGGERSDIDGTIELSSLSLPDASLVFINPAGVLFGRDASIEVPGAFLVSTAEQIHFTDGTIFDAKVGNPPPFTSAPLESFGFLSNSPSEIAIESSTLGELAESPLSFVGGPVTFSDATIAGAGPINVISVPGPGNVSIVGSTLVPDAGLARGPITLALPDSLTVSIESRGENGSIRFFGGETILEGRSTKKAVNASGPGEGIIFDVESLHVSRSRLSTQSEADASSGPISISARGAVIVSSSSQLSTTTDTTGDSGDIEISGASFEAAGFARLRTSTSGSGNAGDVRIRTTGPIVIGPVSFLSSATFDEGDAGSFVLEGENITLANGAIQSASDSTGIAGTITLTANNEVSLSAFSLLSNAVKEGVAGTISIAGKSIEISNGASVSSQASERFESGSGADIILSAADSLRITGRSTQVTSETGGPAEAGGIFIKASNVEVSDRAQVTASTEGSGRAGVIDIDAGKMVIRKGTGVTAKTESTGPGGSIDIDVTGALLLETQGTGGEASTISSESTSTVDGAGAAGTISISAREVLVGNGGEITTQASSGTGGTLGISADTFIRIVKGNLTTSTAGAKAAGAAKLTSASLEISDGGAVLATTSNLGRGGGHYRHGFGSSGDTEQRRQR